MTARVLVVDDVLPNVKLLEAKLSREYFDVLTAMSGPEALEIVAAETPDIVLLDVMMPEMDGFEVCRRLKADPKTMHIPVVMVTALSDSSDRVQGLEAGADDFLTKPVNDIALFARVKSLVRLKMMMDELRLREMTSNSFGVADAVSTQITAENGNILAIEDREIYARNIQRTLAEHHTVTMTASAEDCMTHARAGGLDLIIISLALQDTDGLRLCTQFRSMEETRQVPLLILVEDTPEEMERLVKALDLGVNDYLIRPVDQNELKARCATQIRRKRYEDHLRASYHMSMELAVTDSLTGLYNRRYLQTHLDNLIERARREGKPISLMMMDLDHFKDVNDTHGHSAGDAVLREFALRVQRCIRGMDLAARHGGEEFVVVMPDTDLELASGVGERLREMVAESPMRYHPENLDIPVTVSIGVAGIEGAGGGADDLLRLADEALYDAKHKGRNRVVISSAMSARIEAQAS